MSNQSLFSVVTLFALLSFGARPSFASGHTMFDDVEPTQSGSVLDEKGAWNPPNTPSKWDSHYEYRFDQLPATGQMTDHTPWSDTYWPSNEAGIAARWNQKGSNGFTYSLFTEAQIRHMSQEDLARLSPAEKYDVYMGNFDYPTVKMVRKATNPHAASWAGICHGWSPAALNHAEPAAVIATGPSGLAIPFGSADVKALLDEYYANNEVANEFLGVRCNKSGNIFRKIIGIFTPCDGVNAGALHIILSNELGVRHHGFVANVTLDQVWNQPVYSFKSQVVGTRKPTSDAAPGTVKEMLIHTEMTYAKEIDPQWAPVVGTPDFASETALYDYSVELDAAGRIIGGQWISSDRPDFLWNATQLQFTGYYGGLNGIYRPAVAPLPQN